VPRGPRRRTTNAMALQFRHSATLDSARRVASNVSTVVLTSVASRAVTWLRHARQMYLGLYASRKAWISTGMGDEHAPRLWRRQQPHGDGGHTETKASDS